MTISVFGIVSVTAPYAMMQFTAAIGLETLSGDYAYQEYERSGDMDCLARSFLIAVQHKKYRTAEERFEILCKEDRFDEYCDGVEAPDVLGGYSYRDFLFGRAAIVKYHLKREDALSFAVDKTDASFPAGNPVTALAVEAASEKDADFCAALLEALEGGGFAQNDRYLSLVAILEGVINS